MVKHKIAPEESNRLAVEKSNKHTSNGSGSKTRLNMNWENLGNVKYLDRGGFSYIYKAELNDKSVVVKKLKPKFRVRRFAINGMEDEVEIQSKLDHDNIVNLIAAGLDNRGDRFVVMEHVDGGTLSQALGYNSIFRLWKKNPMPYIDVLTSARSLASGMQYLHEEAIPNAMVLHRDLKPENIGLMSDGTVKVLDFGLARIVGNADSKCDEAYNMTAQVGSLRYMAPEVAKGQPYNHKADVHSFGIILWEMLAGEKSFRDLYNLHDFAVAVFKDGTRPPLKEKWPDEFCALISDCWDRDMDKRPDFDDVIQRIDSLLSNEEESASSKKSFEKKKKLSFIHKIRRSLDCRRH